MINSLTISLQHAGQIRFVNDAPERGGTGVDYGLCINGRSIFPERSGKAVGKDRFCKGEKECPTECLKEDEDGHGDGGLGLREAVLDCNDGLDNC